MSYFNQPLGTIIASVLNYDQLTAVIGEDRGVNNKKSSYAPCDGRSIQGSALEKLTNPPQGEPETADHIKNTPDLRGKFLRGLNIMYSTGQPLPFDANINGDPETNRTVSHYQRDAFKQHAHRYIHFDGGVVSDYSNDQDDRKASYGNMVNDVTANAGEDRDIETRPRNISVYYYIKIN